MKKAVIISSLFLFLQLGILASCLANNITVSAISLTNRTTSTQTVRVNFTLNWENSWRTTSAPFNWDAAWVFVKYKVGPTGEWKHATLASSGHTLPGIAASTQPDATGIFIYRSAAGGPSTFNPTGIQLQWNYGSDGVSNEAQIFVRVFAIEMVYNPPGGFQAGSGAISNGEFRRANDVTASAPASTFTVTGSLPTFQSNNSSSSANNIAAYNNTASDLTGTATASLNAGYASGFNAFYSMKYEISQQQYVDFLNTLTYTQQAARTASANPPNSAAGTGALINPNANRNGIDIQTPGTSSTVPAVYACNLDNDGNYNEADDGQHIACNYLSWDDLTAYLDWAGLRPMTELEFEKSCRGNQSPVASEYPWGTTSATALSGLINSGLTNEVASNAGANIAFNNSFNSGPVRNGIFANSGTTRSQSGAGYYGNMDLGGNLWERVVTIGTSDGRTFSATHGNGTLASSGAADVIGWPAASGSGWKGGSWLNNTSGTANTSNRILTANTDNTRVSDAGGRGVRTISSGIVTDGLILWLDAGITSSYPESGTTWTDLSGNRNNGTLVNGPTYLSSNGGSMTFNGSNQRVSTNFKPSGQRSYFIWVRYNSVNSLPNGFSLSGTQEVSAYNYVGIANGGTFYYYAGTSGGLINSNVLSANTWYQQGFVLFSDGSRKLYLNGNEIATDSGGLGNTSTAEFSVGCVNTNHWVNGQIPVVMQYNRALSASEITQNFNAQKARFGL